MIHSENGFFNEFGGKYVAEVLRRPLDELEIAFNEAMKDKSFLAELETSVIILAAKLRFCMQRQQQKFLVVHRFI